MKCKIVTKGQDEDSQELTSNLLMMTLAKSMRFIILYKEGTNMKIGLSSSLINKSFKQVILGFILVVVMQGCAQTLKTADFTPAHSNIEAPYTSGPYSMLQRYGKPKLTPIAQTYWDNFTPDMDPAIQCLPSTLARDLFSPAGILVEYIDNGNIRLSNETVFMDGRNFPDEYSMENRGKWPSSDVGYSIGYWQGGVLFTETRGLIERDILMGHIPILPSTHLIIKRQFKLVDIDQRWEARGLAPQEVNAFLVSEEDGGKTLEMDVWLDDPVNLEETWHVVKQYREVNDATAVTTSGDIPIVTGNQPSWEHSDAAANSGVPKEFLENYDGGCILFPEYDTSEESDSTHDL
jgi:hypothetical protein